MSPPRSFTGDDAEQYERYLLGLLPDDARERLDEASIVDDEVAARVRHAETELIDSYVRGQLSGSTLERFESYYLSSPRRREKVTLAASFLSGIDRSVARAETTASRAIAAGRLAPIALAAALVLAASGVVFLQMRNRDASTPATTASSDAVERPAPEPVPEPLPAAPARPITASAVSPERIVALVLPAPTRAVAPLPTLAIAAAVTSARFELQLETNDFPSYRVALKEPAADRILWRSEWVAPRSSADQASVAILVPAHLLAPRDYSLDLAGRGSGGQAEVIGSYLVRVVRP